MQPASVPVLALQNEMPGVRRVADLVQGRERLLQLAVASMATLVETGFLHRHFPGTGFRSDPHHLGVRPSELLPEKAQWGHSVPVAPPDQIGSRVLGVIQIDLRPWGVNDRGSRVGRQASTRNFM